ncbi:protein of unknown function [Methylocella tundrae]|uniref:Phage integrase central domain-containing protein n=1 Tax=Methylocella tundrae TaxID=227605 RepID=A0A4U8YVH9_METTU|nr:protein of unknown function [Methylocella tundrae]
MSLATARELAKAMRESLAKGIDPLDGREAQRLAKAAQLTFGQCADALLAAKSPAWRNEKHRAQWAMTLEKYAAPLRSLSVAARRAAGLATALAAKARDRQPIKRADRSSDRLIPSSWSHH